MHCPACQAPLHEMVENCPDCDFSLPALDACMGIPLQLKPPVVDLSKRLAEAARERLQEIISQFKQRFPELSPVIVVSDLPKDVTAELYGFWLFNRCSLFSPVQCGGENMGLLLLLDAQRQQALAFMGYGLEPLVATHHLKICLDAAGFSLQSTGITAAASIFFSSLTTELVTLSYQWPRLFGFNENEPWFDACSGTLHETTIRQSGDLY
jgi:hypothetical protein